MASLSGTLATMGSGVPYAIAAKFAHPDRPVIALVGDGAMQMNGIDRADHDRQVLARTGAIRGSSCCVLNNRDLNQVTWEQRALDGRPDATPASQDLPTSPTPRYAELIGLRGIRVDDPDQVGATPGTRRSPPTGRSCSRRSSIRRFDLVVTKTAEPTTVQEGELITWTMTVTNESSVEAVDVNGARTDDRPYGMRVLSLTTSQGVCVIGAGCQLGRLLPGDSVTVTAVTRATQVGDAVNCVEVGSEEIESDYLNNTACALARVTGNPPPIAERCGSLLAAPGLTQGRAGVRRPGDGPESRRWTARGRPGSGARGRRRGERPDERAGSRPLHVHPAAAAASSASRASGPERRP